MLYEIESLIQPYRWLSNILTGTRWQVILGWLLFFIAWSPVAKAVDLDSSGVVAAELREFTSSPNYPQQHEGTDYSVYFQPEFVAKMKGGDRRFVFVPFYRADSQDENRTHGDIRELYWSDYEGDLGLKVGITKVFWGVTEFAHLADVINQTDLVEDVDAKTKLGQPMINATLFNAWGTFDFIAMPWFRERTFPGVNGRLRSPYPVETALTDYESSAGKRHVDLAVHWSHYVGDLEMGLYHFVGTSREPRLIPTLYMGEIVLAPYYDQMQQSGMTLQLVAGEWLWKLEAIRRQTLGETFYASTGGFEYTFVGIGGSAMDLGAIGEYVSDGRSDRLPVQPFQHDAVLGARLQFNDDSSTQLLVTYAHDTHNGAGLLSLEASRRLFDSVKLSLLARSFLHENPDNALYSYRDDDYLKLELAYYF